MKKTTGLLLLGAFSLLTTVSVLHGCGAKEDAAGPAAPAPPATPAAAKFTIVGAGN